MAYPCGQISPELCTNKKVLRLLSLPGGREAIGLWTLADSWCNRELTDGHVPSFMVDRLGWKDRFAALLVEAGLWVRTPTGYQFHDWEDFNELKVDVLRTRSKWAAKRGNVRTSKRSEKALLRHESPGDSTRDSSGDSPGESSPFGVGVDLDQKKPPVVPRDGSPGDHDAPPGFSEPNAFARRAESKRLAADNLGMSLAVGKAADEADTEAPWCSHDHLAAAAKRAAGAAQRLGRPVDECMLETSRRALQEARQAKDLKRFGFFLVAVDLAAPAGSQTPSRPGRLPKTHGTSAEDFEDVPELDEQLRAHGLLGDEP